MAAPILEWSLTKVQKVIFLKTLFEVSLMDFWLKLIKKTPDPALKFFLKIVYKAAYFLKKESFFEFLIFKLLIVNGLVSQPIFMSTCLA